MKLKCPRCGYPISAVLAAHAGKFTSRKKAAAARRNARLGGWPKGKKRGKRKKKAPRQSK